MVHSPYGALTLYGTPHSRRLRRVPVLADGGLTYNSNQAFTRSDSGLGFSLFTRRYLGNRCCFLFHRLVICLSSAGRSYTPQVGNTKKTLWPQERILRDHRVSKAEALNLSPVCRNSQSQFPSRRWMIFVNDTEARMSKAETRSQMRSTT